MPQTWKCGGEQECCKAEEQHTHDQIHPALVITLCHSVVIQGLGIRQGGRHRGWAEPSGRTDLPGRPWPLFCYAGRHVLVCIRAMPAHDLASFPIEVALAAEKNLEAMLLTGLMHPPGPRGVTTCCKSQAPGQSLLSASKG